MDEIVEQLRLPNVLVSPFLLLLLAESPGHGYQLVERLKSVGFTERRAGSLYRELRRLEDEGLVTSHWEASQTRGPARRVYELTTAGRRSLRACVAGAEGLTLTLNEFADRAELAGRRRVNRRHRPLDRALPAVHS